MSLMNCDRCGDQIDTDYEEMYGSPDGMVCEDCVIALEEEAEEAAEEGELTGETTFEWAKRMGGF